MANDIFFISDTHFNHANILNFTNDDGTPARLNPLYTEPRKFLHIEEMNEIIIQNWNAVIKPYDKVYHLGDVIMGPKDEYARILSRLNGRKRLILGNHDQIVDTRLLEFFEKVEVWRLFKDHGFICTHIPIHPDNFRAKCTINVHGHVHNNDMTEQHYKNICVEKTGYKPLHLEQIKALIKNRK